MTTLEAIAVVVHFLVHFLVACAMLFVTLSIFTDARKKSKLDITAAVAMTVGAVSCFGLAYLYAR